MTPSQPDTHSPTLDALARQTGFPPDAVASMTRSIVAGGGRMAQFDHPAFGGPGQWMHGGLLMISDLSDHGLRERVARLCAAIAEQLPTARDDIAESSRSQSQLSGGHATVADAPASRDGWPASLGSPDTSGAQNDMRYAWFAASRRLAIDDGGTVTLYDTGDHRIGGVSQQQGGLRTLAFTSQHGVVDLASLPVVGTEVDGPASPEPTRATATDHPVTASSSADPFQALEKLAALHARGIVADEEFARKKAELLARI